MLPKSFKPVSINEKLEETGMKGKNFIFLTDWTKQQLLSLFEAAEMIEPFWKNSLRLMDGRVLGTIFFQPSTRTRFSTEDAMVRLGGSVLSESNPLHSSSTAKGESLFDYLRTVFDLHRYNRVAPLRRRGRLPFARRLDRPGDKLRMGQRDAPDAGAARPVHLLQGLRQLRRDARHDRHAGPSRARSGHSFAMGLAQMGAEIVYVGSSQNKIPELIQGKLDAAGAKYKIYNDLSNDEMMELMGSCDTCYLPGCSVPKDNPEERAAFLDLIRPFYITLEGLQTVKKKFGKTVGIMHSLPRNEVEFEKTIDDSEFQLYFQQMAFSVPIRMALIARWPE